MFLYSVIYVLVSCFNWNQTDMSLGCFKIESVLVMNHGMLVVVADCSKAL